MIKFHYRIRKLPATKPVRFEMILQSDEAAIQKIVSYSELEDILKKVRECDGVLKLEGFTVCASKTTYARMIEYIELILEETK